MDQGGPLLSSCHRLLATARRHPWRTVGVLILAVSCAGLAAWHLRAWGHYGAALRSWERRDFTNALNHLAVCLNTWPGSASPHLLAARSARRANRPDAAEKLIAACQRLDAPAEETILEHYLLQVQQGRQNLVDKKLRAFLAKGHPNAWLILEALSDQGMKTYRLDLALDYLEQWLKIRPGDREALVRKGWVLEHLAEFPGALGAYQKALEADPERDRLEQDRIRLRLAELLVKQIKPQEAAGHLAVLRQRQPRNPAVLLALARCRFLQGQTESANQLLDELLAEQPDHGPALGERGRIALETGQPAQAEPWLRKAIARLPGDRNIVSYFLGCLRRLGKDAEAKKYALRLQQIRDDEARMGQLMRDVLASPQDPDLRWQVGNIFLSNGFTEDGLKWLNLALSFDPGYRPAHQALAEYYESIGQPERALPHRQALTPPSP